MSESQAELPRYQSHKIVWALKIKSVLPAESPDGVCHGGVIVPADAGHHPFTVSADFMDKHQPAAGGYYVLYNDGYASFSPKEAFEQGYTRL